jgi:Spy/CpxP family protein refolding chaperone
MKKPVISLLMLCITAVATAQPVGPSVEERRHERMPHWQNATPEQREQWREQRRQRREKWQEMSPEEREQLRRDIRDSGQSLHPRRQHRRED